MLPENPSVLVLLVVADGSRWLPEVLKGLRGQAHRPISALAVDNASTDGSAEILTKAFGARRVITLDRRIGYGRALATALKVAADRGVAADAFLLVHDDAALERGAVEAMIETMRATGAGIVGAKHLDWDDPRALLEVGPATDRYGRLVPLVERGEIDQGQHDGVREVLYTSSAAMLVSREVVETVGLFDTRYVALRDDLDLCWRARLAGFPTYVTTDATVRHALATIRGQRTGPVRGRARYFTDRNVIATLLKNYSWPRLLVALPTALAITLGVSLLSLATGRTRTALQTLEALQWNAVHLPSTLRARRRVQRARTQPDSAVTALMRHGATRLRAQFEQAVERIVGPPEALTVEALDTPAPSVVRRLLGHPGGIVGVLAVAVLLLGSRTLLSQGQVGGLDLAPFSRAGGFFEEWASGWRGAGFGGAGPATPGLVVLGLLTLASFGSAWLAQRVVMFGVPVIGAIAMWRLLGALGIGRGARRLATVVFAASPLMLGLFGAGRLPDMIVLAAGPLLLLPLLRAAGIAPARGWRSVGGGIAGLAVVASLAPWALVFVVIAAAVLGAASIRAGTANAVARRAGLMLGGALALTFPWSVELFRSRTPLLAGGHDPLASMSELLALSAGSVRPIAWVAGFGLAAAAALGAMAAPAERRRLVAISGLLGLAGLLLAWGVGRGQTWFAPRQALPLSLAAVSLPVLVAIAFDVAGPILRRRTFGVAHLGFAVAGGLLAVQIGVGALWIARAQTPVLVQAGDILPQHLAEEARRAGSFRIAWVGGTARQPLASVSGPGGVTMREHLARPAGAGADALERTIAAIASGATEAGGRALATLGVRYVIVRPEAGPDIRDAVARQVDLSFSQRFRGAVVYVNEVGLPNAATVSAPGWIVASRGSIEGVAAAESASVPGPGMTREGHTRYVGRSGKATRGLLVAEDFSQDWRARTSGGATLSPQRSFGWAMRFAVTTPGEQVSVEYRGQRFHRFLLLLQVLGWVAFAAWWSRAAGRERGER